jgi:hypothetical protein
MLDIEAVVTYVTDYTIATQNSSCINFTYWQQASSLYGDRPLKYLHSLSAFLLFFPALDNVYNCGRSCVLFSNVNVNVQNYIQNIKILTF